MLVYFYHTQLMLSTIVLLELNLELKTLKVNDPVVKDVTDLITQELGNSGSNSKSE